MTNRSTMRRWIAVTVLASSSLISCKQEDDTKRLIEALEKVEAPTAKTSAQNDAEINPRLLRRFEPLRSSVPNAANPSTSEKVALGRMLYFEKRLSKNHDLSCNSCHDLNNYGVDNKRFSPGHRGQLGGRNSPTVYNAAGLFVQFWDGRAPDVEAQATGPITNPVEMAAVSSAEVVKVLTSMPDYVQRFRASFPDEKEPLTIGNVGKAIGAFERGLMTPSRWDKYLGGKKDALSSAELDGLKTFTSLGCMVCHTGELVGGSMHQKLGAVVPWPNQKDQGRFEITKAEADRMVFRVPTLRNVARTAPYFHDGSAETLPDAIRMMAKHQLGLTPSTEEVTAIASWLESLTGDLPTDYIKPPTLPESTALTPKAKPN